MSVPYNVVCTWCGEVFAGSRDVPAPAYAIGHAAHVCAGCLALLTGLLNDPESRARIEDENQRDPVIEERLRAFTRGEL